MEGKLIKLEESKYTLVYKEGNITWENNPAFDGKLSLKNCQAIENGYDLDELVKEQYPIDEPSFKRGFKLAIEILGDKKFSEKDVISMIEKSRETGLAAEYLMLTKQQTEWDVEIEMWFHGTRHKKGEWIPKLDEDGCLILKKK